MEEPQNPASEATEPATPSEPAAPPPDPVAARKRAIVGLSAAIVIGGVATGIAYYAEKYTGHVARVDGTSVPKGEYDRLLAATKRRYQQDYNVDFASAQGQAMEADLRSGLMTQLVERELIRQEAVKRGITITDTDVEAKIAEIRKGFKDDAAFEAKLKANGLDRPTFARQVREQLEVERVVQDVAKESPVTEADAKAYYDQNLKLYDKKQEVRARHILVKDEATAKLVEGKVKAGGDFAKLAAEYSEDPGSKGEGGDLGYFARGRMVKEFEDTAFATEPGQVAPLVKTRFGWHLIKVEDRKAPRTQPFAEVKAEIQENLASERRRTTFSRWLEQRKAQAKIEYKPGYQPPAKPVGGEDPGEGGHGHGPGDGHGH